MKESKALFEKFTMKIGGKKIVKLQFKLAVSKMQSLAKSGKVWQSLAKSGKVSKMQSLAKCLKCKV